MAYAYLERLNGHSALLFFLLDDVDDVGYNLIGDVVDMTTSLTNNNPSSIVLYFHSLADMAWQNATIYKL